MAETNSTLPVILVGVPGIEGFSEVASYLEVAGAEITRKHRTFAIRGPLTAEQATATWRLATYEDSNSVGNQLDVRVDGGGEVETALKVMCPGGFDWDEDVDLTWHPDGWWAGQQERQKELLRQPETPAWPLAAVEVCCGEGGSWASAGKPFAAGCGVCPRSPTYWQRGRTTPYIAKPLGNDIDLVDLAARLRGIAADPDWPGSLRAAAQVAVDEGLEVYELTDDAIVAALNKRIAARAAQAATPDSAAAVRARLAP